MSWGNPKSAQEKLLALSLSPASLVYQSAALARLFAYGAGILPAQSVSCPVISVGNLTVGGTGKTPLTIDIARRLVKAGYRLGILSRGYKRLSTDNLVVVSDGRGKVADCAASGDEPYMMALAVPEAAVIVASKRAQAAHVAVRDYGCDMLLLDDGFQHLALARTQDIVLIDYADEPENDRVLPAGRLREPLSALTRADWVVITKVPEQESPERAAKLAHLERLIKRHAPHALISQCQFLPSTLTSFNAGESSPAAEALAGQRLVSFSGIARPERFNDQLRDLGAVVTATRHFADHHWFLPEDMALIERDCQIAGASMIVTTEKDAARLNRHLVGNLPLFVLGLEVRWLGEGPVGLPVDAPVTPSQALTGV